VAAVVSARVAAMKGAEDRGGDGGSWRARGRERGERHQREWIGLVEGAGVESGTFSPLIVLVFGALWTKKTKIWELNFSKGDPNRA
jgi:hypothetical protein